MSELNQLEAVTRSVIDIGFHIHQDLGPGLLESAYGALLAAALVHHGHAVRR